MTTPSSPVGRFPGNGYGLYDMIGNVWVDQRLVPGPRRRSQWLLHTGELLRSS